MPLAEKGVRGKGRQPLSPPQHAVTPSAISARLWVLRDTGFCIYWFGDSTRRGNVISEPQQALAAGAELLDDLMRSHGFVYNPTAAGVGSGGSFASGEFRRGNRRLELHYRYSLGLVTYHVGNLALSHEDYMWSVLDGRWRSEYPGFSKELLDDFRHLRADLEHHCTDFLGGSDAAFESHFQRAEVLKKTTSRLP